MEYIETHERRQNTGFHKSRECTLISVADINAARKFYEDLFGLEVFQEYGKNIAITCGLALQQDFDDFLNKLKQYPDTER